MLTAIRDDTWNVLNLQHIALNPKRWNYSDIAGGGHKKIKWPAHKAEGGQYLRKDPNPYPHADMWKTILFIQGLNKMTKTLAFRIYLTHGMFLYPNYNSNN